MTTWIVSGWVHLIVGFVIGWVVFNRPQWAQKLVDRFRAWAHI